MKTFFRMMVLLMVSLAIWTGCSSDSESAEPVVLTGIQIDAANVKKTYFASEKLDLSGLVVTANYSNGTSKVLSKEEYEVTPVNGSSFTNDGELTVTVTFNGMSDSFVVNVNAVQLESIELDTANVKKTYFVSEELNLDGLLVTAVFNNGTNRVLSKEEYSVSPSADTIFNNGGEKTITIDYNGKTDSFKVNVLKNSFSEVQITFPDEYQDKTDLLTYSEESKSFTAAEGYKNYVWWLDGEILTGTAGTNYTPENLEDGNHSLMLVVTDSTDEVYSATATFTIQK